MDAMKRFLMKGNFHDVGKNGEKASHVPLYLGSGDFGGCFDGNGVMSQPFLSRVHQNTVFMHADFWHRGAFGLDYHLPMLQIDYINFDAHKVQSREQLLEVSEGYLLTKLTYGQSTLQTKAYFNPYLRDVFALEMSYNSKMPDDLPDLVIKNIETVEVDYKVVLNSALHLVEKEANLCEYELVAGNASVTIFTRIIEEEGRAEVIADAHAYKIRLRSEQGKLLLLVGVGSPNRKAQIKQDMKAIQCRQTYSEFAQNSWRKRWGDSLLSFDDPNLDALFVRSIYYMLCSFSPASNCIAPPTGWTASNWAYHFPQDFSLMTPVLLKMGHLDIVKAKIAFYARHIPSMLDYTKRIYQAKGTMWAWEFPIGDHATVLPDAYPNWYQFEIHNAAYPAKMAYEVALYMDDLEWIREVAWPMIYHSAQFYASIVRQEEGKWGIHLYPSMGQDELGGENAKNYLCSLYAAKYTLEKAVIMAHSLNLELDELQCWEDILSDGFAFDRLIHKRLSIYQNFETDETSYEIGHMKHPVPLMPITFLPQDELDVYEKNAYAMRYQLCDKSNEHYYHGWSLVSLMLADVRMGDQEAFFKDFAEMPVADYVDKDFLQIYESSQLTPCIYYLASHGLFAQAVIEGAVTEQKLDLKHLHYQNIHLFHGKVQGGTYEGV